MAERSGTLALDDLDRQLELHRGELTGYCYRMLGSPFEAEDAVQETMLRAWRGQHRFEGRSSLRSWLYSIATNVCLDMLRGSGRRALPIDLGPAGAPELANLCQLPEASWVQPIPDALLSSGSDPADAAVARESVKLAFVAALQHLPARQRAALILCEVLSWKAAEAAKLLDTSVPSINSALQRARATLRSAGVSVETPSPTLDAAQLDAAQLDAAQLDAGKRQLLARYVDAFEAYDIDAFTDIIREDAIQSMPPYELWLRGRQDILAWWAGPGIGCRGSRLTPALQANGTVAFGQYRRSESREGHDPWALQVLELGDGGIVKLTFFLEAQRIFPLFGLPLHLSEGPEGS